MSFYSVPSRGSGVAAAVRLGRGGLAPLAPLVPAAPLGAGPALAALRAARAGARPRPHHLAALARRPDCLHVPVTVATLSGI